MYNVKFFCVVDGSVYAGEELLSFVSVSNVGEFFRLSIASERKGTKKAEKRFTSVTFTANCVREKRNEHLRAHCSIRS